MPKDGMTQYHEYIVEHSLTDTPARYEIWSAAWNAAIDWYADRVTEAMSKATKDEQSTMHITQIGEA